MSPANILSIFAVIFIWVMFGIGYRKIIRGLPSDDKFDEIDEEEFD
jgi:hypothetical protein